MAYLRALSHIETMQSVKVLVQISLADKDPRLQDLAAGGIARMRNRTDAVELLARAIGNGKNRERALQVLDQAELATPVSPGELPNPVLTSSLIDSLWVEQTRWVEGEFFTWHQIPTHAFGGIRSHHGWGYHRGLFPVETLVKNPETYETLKRYTGQDYGYDQDAWRTWHNAGQRESADEIP